MLTTAFAKVGFSGDYGGTWFLTRLVGIGQGPRAVPASPTCRPPSEAQGSALVNGLFPPTRSTTRARDVAHRLAAGPTIAYRYMKENLNRAIDGELNECLDMEAAHHIHCGQTEDHKEAGQAFVEKRPPTFHGR